MDHSPQRARRASRPSWLKRFAKDAAASSLVSFLMGALIYSAAISVALAYHMSAVKGSEDVDGSELSVLARDALSLILTDAGRTSSGSSALTAWHLDADNLTRFGLAAAGTPNLLDYSKVNALRHGLMEETANGHPDYEEVKRALGFTDHDFHIRTYPVLISVDDANWAPYRSIRPAYLAHYDAPVFPVDVTLSHAAVTGAHDVLVDVTNKAAGPMIYRVSFVLNTTANGNKNVVDDQMTPLLAPGASGTVKMRYHDAAWSLSSYKLGIKVTDAYGNEVAARWIENMAMNSQSSPDINFIADAGGTHFVQGNPVVLHIDHFTGNGGRKNNDYVARLAIADPSGTEIVNTTVTLPKNKATTYSCPASTCSAAGSYLAKVMTNAASPTRVAVDRFHVAAAPLFTDTLLPNPDATDEIGILSSLFADFDPTLYDAATNPTGDVFQDADHGTRTLVSRLDDYGILIVGSGVRQSSLAPGDVKHGIADWVTAGGTLIVLGSGNQNYQWLQPLHGAGVMTANGGVSAPDPTHAMLHVPEKLGYNRYQDHNEAWRLKRDDLYTHVLAKPDHASGSSQSTMAVSNAGVFGEGTVVLTSYIGARLTDPQDLDESRKFMHNLVTQSFNMLFLDYGPPIPPDAAVGSSTRLAMVKHPEVEDALVEVHIVLYVFR